MSDTAGITAEDMQYFAKQGYKVLWNEKNTSSTVTISYNKKRTYCADCAEAAQQKWINIICWDYHHNSEHT